MSARSWFSLATRVGDRTYLYAALGEFKTLAAARARYESVLGRGAGDFVREYIDLGYGYDVRDHGVMEATR